MQPVKIIVRYENKSCVGSCYKSVLITSRSVQGMSKISLIARVMVGVDVSRRILQVL